MAERLHGRQDDDRAARSPHPPLRYHRNRKRQLALQEPWRRSPHNPRSRRLRNPNQLRRRERYRPDSSPKRVKIGRRSGVKFGRRLTLLHPPTEIGDQLLEFEAAFLRQVVADVRERNWPRRADSCDHGAVVFVWLLL